MIANDDLDQDLDGKDYQWLTAEVKKLRAAIRQHRDSTGHDLCWHHPALWSLLPEKTTPEVAVPPWETFMSGCITYRASLEQELPNAPIDNTPPK